MSSHDYAKRIIKKYLDKDLKNVLEKSYLNCHVKGLHSFVLNTEPSVVRLFVTDENHELWRNEIGSPALSLGFHPHHCNLVLNCVTGSFKNIIAAKPTEKRFDIGWFSIMNKYHYNSKITKGKIGFTKVEDAIQVYIDYSRTHAIKEDMSVMMIAGKYHTVFVEKGQKSAWLVYEGKEDEDYEPFTYSNVDLEEQDFSELYQKPSREKMIEILKGVDLYE